MAARRFRRDCTRMSIVVAVFVDGPPQILLPPLDLHEQLVQMPCVAHAAPAAPQPPRVVEPERPTPTTSGARWTRRSRAVERLTRPPEPSPPRVWIIASNERTAAHLAMLHARATVALYYVRAKPSGAKRRVAEHGHLTRHRMQRRHAVQIAPVSDNSKRHSAQVACPFEFGHDRDQHLPWTRVPGRWIRTNRVGSGGRPNPSAGLDGLLAVSP